MRAIILIFGLSLALYIGITVADFTSPFGANTKKIGVRTNGRQTSLTPPTISDKSLPFQALSRSNKFKPLDALQPVFVFGIVSTLMLNLGRFVGIDRWVSAQIDKLRTNRLALKQAAITEKEEIWTTLRSLQEGQRETETCAQRLADELEDLKRTLTSSIAEVDSTLQGIISRTEALERKCDDVAEAVVMERHGSLRELEAGLTQLEDQQQQEGRALTASVSQLREEVQEVQQQVPRLITRHEQALGRRLDQFKRDLRALIGKVAAARSKHK